MSVRTMIDLDPHLHIEQLKDVFDAPTIIRVTRFDEESLCKFESEIEEAHWTKQPVIPIVIDSYGGSTYALMGMLSSIENAKLPIATIVGAKAFSCGAILFAFGANGYRFMHPDAVLMYHDVDIYNEGKIEEVKVNTRQADSLNKLIYRKMARHTGHEPSYFLDLISKKKHVDWYLTAREAKKHNIVNELRIPNFEVKIGVEITFV